MGSPEMPGVHQPSTFSRNISISMFIHYIISFLTVLVFTSSHSSLQFVQLLLYLALRQPHPWIEHMIMVSEFRVGAAIADWHTVSRHTRIPGPGRG